MGRSLDVGNEAGTEKRFGKTWARVPTTRIEDLADAVFGGGLEAMQMSLPRVAGSLAFAEHDGVLYSTGLIGGQVALAARPCRKA